jgi:hypothetical protein
MNATTADDAGGGLVAGYVSLRHSTAAIGRSAMAYSNIRRIWWPLAYLDLPLIWMFHAAVIAHRPGELVTLGKASAQLADRDHRVLTVHPPARARRLLLALIVLDFVAVFLLPISVVAASTPRPIHLIALAWLLLLAGLPYLTYVFPAVVQQWLGRGLGEWKSASLADTRLRPTVVSQLGAWPCTGGGRRGNGDGFKLMRALAAEERKSDQIMVGVARGKKLAERYVEDTDAEQSSHNPRHLRWPRRAE